MNDEHKAAVVRTILSYNDKIDNTVNECQVTTTTGH